MFGEAHCISISSFINMTKIVLYADASSLFVSDAHANRLVSDSPTLMMSMGNYFSVVETKAVTVACEMSG